jgi:hypothetical protein
VKNLVGFLDVNNADFSWVNNHFTSLADSQITNPFNTQHQ